MAAKKKRRSYTKAQRDAVLADVPTIGVSATARKHGVPQTSVSGWLRARSREGFMVAAARRQTPPTPVAPTPRETPTATRTASSRVAKVYTPSQKALVLEDAAKDGVTAAAKKHGISRFSIYDWQPREEGGGGSGSVADERTGPQGHRAAARRRDPRRVQDAPRTGTEPDRQPASAQGDQGLGAQASSR